MSGQARQAMRADEALALGQSILRQESAALLRLSQQLDQSFTQAVERVLACHGSVIVSGIGKAGLIGQKIAATLASTGTRSHFLHPAEAVHGDLGRIHATDTVVVLSYSGETEEVIRLLPPLTQLGTPIIAITGRRRSALARRATVTLWLGELQEACPLQLAPTTSTTAMLALGDALALAVSQRRGFAAADFARFHPGGSLGRRLSRVEDVMRPRDQCRLAQDDRTVRQTLVAVGRPGRRTGAILLTNESGQLSGLFTDSDLARLLERQQDHLLDQPICQVMTRSPATVTAGMLMPAALDILTARKISELPVVNTAHEPIGIIDITDVVAFLPLGDAAANSHQEAPHDVSPLPHILPLSNREPKKHVNET